MVDEASFHGDLWRNTSRQIKARLPRVQVVVCGNPAFAAVAGGQPGNSIIPGAPLQPSNFSQLEEGRTKLLLAPVPEGMTAVSEVDQRLSLWERGSFSELLQRAEEQRIIRRSD